MCMDKFVLTYLCSLCINTDIDECRASPCQHGCVNTVGSYRCTCSEGFRATRTGHCVDQDECAFGVPSCFDCINTIGRYAHVCLHFIDDAA